MTHLPQDFHLQRTDFNSDFIWGVSTAAYQIEGAYNSYGKGRSIWDEFTAKKETIYKGQHANVSCDFYHKYQEDILLMKAMNIPHYRFSISWSRILPEGIGVVNQDGIDFYNRVIDFCLACDITPWITLYHWDLPLDLEQKGGWTNRDILGWFETYVQLCLRYFGDRVRHWMVLNEPMVFTGAGYFLGVHAPGRKGIHNFLPAVHHATLCQALGGRLIKSADPNSQVGTTFSCSQVTPFSDHHKDIVAAQKADALLNRLFIEPSLGMGYPTQTIKALERIENYQKPEDIDHMCFDFDFIGIQNYTREVVKHSCFVPYLNAKIINASLRNVATTVMDWEVYPPCIYHMIKQFDNYPGVRNIIITENGAAFPDTVKDQQVHDPDRTHYLQTHLEQVHKAISEHAKVGGYFIWTFMDNFEWAEGYHPRFGIVHVNFETQKRIIKSSGLWFKDFLDLA